MAGARADCARQQELGWRGERIGWKPRGGCAEEPQQAVRRETRGEVAQIGGHRIANGWMTIGEQRVAASRIMRRYAGSAMRLWPRSGGDALRATAVQIGQVTATALPGRLAQPTAAEGEGHADEPWSGKQLLQRGAPQRPADPQPVQ